MTSKDLIYRQQAIEALGEAPKFKIGLLKKYAEGRNDQWFDDVAALVNLPSAESERKKGRWIPCSERLPEDGTWNIFSDGKNISVERYKMDAIDHFFPQGRWFSFDEAIAWMPMPEPYGGEENEAD